MKKINKFVVTLIDNSSNIKKIAYCDRCQTFRVQFKSGKVYEYFNIPNAVYDSLLVENKMGGSVGRCYNENIRGQYTSDNLGCIYDDEYVSKWNDNIIDIKNHCQCYYDKTKQVDDAIEEVRSYKYNGMLYESLEEIKEIILNKKLSEVLDRTVFAESSCKNRYYDSDEKILIKHFILTRKNELKDIL